MAYQAKHSKSWRIWIFTGIISVYLIIGVASWFFPELAQEIDLGSMQFQPPFLSGHLLGTDELGRDVLYGLMHGTLVAIQVGVSSVVISLIIGLGVGMIPGYIGDRKISLSIGGMLFFLLGSFLSFFWAFISRSYELNQVEGLWNIEVIFSLFLFIIGVVISFLIGKRIKGKQVCFPLDLLVGRMIEVFDAVPRLVLILVFTLLIGEPSVLNVIWVIGLSNWVGLARLARGEVLKEKAKTYEEAARSLGLSDFQILLKHIFPNSLRPIFVSLTFAISSAILFEATLSFLGIGVPVEEVTWGTMLMQGRKAIHAWWMVVFPGLALFGLVFSLNLLGNEFSKGVNNQYNQLD